MNVNLLKKLLFQLHGKIKNLQVLKRSKKVGFIWLSENNSRL